MWGEMREHKYRIWDHDNNSYIYFDLFNSHKALTAYGTEGEKEEQYIGLNDKNGVEIYEGDILKCVGITSISPGFQTYEFIVEVKYVNEDASFRGIDHKDEQSVGFQYAVIKMGEIIGNIHETPELLQ